MVRVNFGASGSTRGYNPMDNIVKPGFILKKNANWFMVDSVEGMNYQVLVTANGNTAGTEVGNGYRALANISDHGGQEVPHLHFHLFGGERVGKMVE